MLLMLFLTSIGCECFGGSGYSIKKHVISNSGSVSEGGGYRFESTVGQVVMKTSEGSSYKIISGFWAGNNDLIFKNNFE